MSSPHATIMETGKWFGSVVVSVDLEAMDCVIRIDLPEHALKRLQFHSLDEIQAAIQKQYQNRQSDRVAADMVNALKYAGRQISNKQRGAQRHA